MRLTLLLLCLELIVSASHTCRAEPQDGRSDQTGIMIEQWKSPAPIEHSRNEELIERQGGTEVITPDRSPASVRYSAQKPHLERSRKTIPSSDVQLKPGEASTAVEDNPDKMYQALLARGWELYREGNYGQAMESFVGAGKSREAETRRQSELGIAYSLLQQGEKQEAIDYLSSLVAQGYRLPATSEALAPLLVETGRLDEARKILNYLPASQRVAMRSLIEEKSIKARIEQAITAGNRSLLSEVVPDARSIIESCRDTEYFYQVALALSRLGAASAALDLLNDLENCGPEEREWQIRLLTQRLTLLDNLKLIEALRSYVDSDFYGSDLAEIGRGLIWQRLDGLKGTDPLRQSLMETLLLLNPQDHQAMSMLAWVCYNQADYECSERYFRQLLKEDPSDNDTLEGFALTLAKAGAPLEAVAAIESFPGEPSDKVTSILVDLYALLGQQDYENGDYSSAAYYLSAAVERNPERRDLLSLLLWARYRLGRAEGLVPFLFEEYENSPAPQTARAYLDILAETGLEQKRELFVDHLAQTDHPGLRHLAAEAYYARGWEMRAASTDDSDNTCYNGCDRLEIDNTISLRLRNGEDGTSRLQAIAFTGDLQLPASDGRRWNFRLTPLTLESGTAADHPYVGSYYRSLADPDQDFDDLTTGYSVAQPELGLVQEGEPSWQFRAGTTPVGGPINPLPTFSAAIMHGQWQVELVQESVRESILSWVGLNDPYGGQEWGRVVRTGASFRHTIDLEGPWWVSMDGEYHYYWGQNVADNQRLAASISWGRTDPWNNLTRSVGLFTGVSGFDHNDNFYTYGHGGYYSPELMILAGPFVRLTSKSCNRFWWDGQLSVGYSYRRTASAPHYREIREYAPGLSAEAVNDIAQEYEGSSESQLTIDGRLRGLHRLGGSWFLGAEAGINNSSDFSEVQAAVFLRYRFGRGNALCSSAAQASGSFIPTR